MKIVLQKSTGKILQTYSGVEPDDETLIMSSEDDDETKKSSNTRSIDCAICRAVLEVPVIKAGEEAGSVASAFARREYMVTPCRHIFHKHCLESWMRFKLQCPICRDELPPL